MPPERVSELRMVRPLAGRCVMVEREEQLPCRASGTQNRGSIAGAHDVVCRRWHASVPHAAR